MFNSNVRLDWGSAKQYDSPRGEFVVAENEDVLTVKQAAKMLGVTSTALVLAIKRGKLPAHKFGSQWAIKRPDLERYRESRHAGGRPKSNS